MSRIPFATILIIAWSHLGLSASAASPWLAVGNALWMQPKATPDAEAAKGSADPKAFQALLERITKLEAEVERLKNGAPAQPPVAADAGGIMTLVDVAHLGIAYLPSGQSRYVALQLIVANTSTKPVTLAQDQITAEIDGEVRKLEAIPTEIANQGFQYKNQSYNLQSMQPEKSRTVPPGGQLSFWLVFPKLPLANAIPRCKLKLSLGEIKKEIDVNAVQRAMLGLETRRIGPRGCLALLTITGTTTLFNTQALVDEIERLTSQKVARVVVCWSTDAPPPEPQILNWLQTSTSNNGQMRNPNELFPSIPAAVREFHLVKFSDKDTTANLGYRVNNMGPSRIHGSTADAVGAALRTAYLALPRDDLLQEIREGDPLTRAAALAFGGSRLDAEHLPLIFQWIGDKNVEVQKAAIQTLSHFGEAEAIDKLVAYAKRNDETLSSVAIESLAGSRFGTAHDALLELLKNEPPESKKHIVQVLAKYPRPVWSENLYEFANDPNAGLNIEAVKALVQVGHPKLVDVLEAGLKGSDKALRDYAYQILAGRTDERSERLAIEFALLWLKDAPPDGTTNQLLSRTKDTRAVPLLLEQLDRATGDRSTVITLLVQIGDQSVGDKLASKYASMPNSSEKAQILNGLRQFRHPRFREIAGAALSTSDGTLVSTAANALMQDGHPEGEKLLIAALEKQTAAHLIHNITNALANFGTPGARAALLKAKESGDQNKSNYASNALLQIRQRLPEFHYVTQGIQRLQASGQEEDKDAKKQQEKDALELFELALQLDPKMPEAYAGRGKLFLRQEKLAEAGKDFEKAIELKLYPEDGEVMTGLALAKVVDGKLDEAVKLIESGREKHAKRNDGRGLYLYNTACVYSRAMQYLTEHKEVAGAADKILEYRKKALADLEQSIKQGFTDFKWMAKDPDFQALRNDSDFKKLLTTKPADSTEDDMKEPDNNE